MGFFDQAEEKELKLARALSAYSRRQILRLLAEKELRVKDIASLTNLSISLTSRHLTLLYDLGFLNLRKESTQKYYSLKIKELRQLLDSYDSVIKKI